MSDLERYGDYEQINGAIANELRDIVAHLLQQLGLMTIARDHEKRLRESCEEALTQKGSQLQRYQEAVKEHNEKMACMCGDNYVKDHGHLFDCLYGCSITIESEGEG